MLQERFDEAFKELMFDEGGYSNVPSDLGGATNYGITQLELNRVHKALDLPASVNELTLDDAKAYYKTQWWDKFHYDSINSRVIAAKVFNMAVNMGAFEAHKLLQNAMNWLGYKIAVDGILGNKTLNAINEICLHGREEDLKFELQEEQENFYTQLVKDRPQLNAFLKGWLNRASR